MRSVSYAYSNLSSLSTGVPLRAVIDAFRTLPCTEVVETLSQPLESNLSVLLPTPSCSTEHITFRATALQHQSYTGER